MTRRTFPPILAKACAAGLLVSGLVTSLPAQLINPLPPLTASGLEVEIEEWLTIPASSGSAPKARINHVKPCPDGVRLFCNDLRGKLWVIADNEATQATLFLDLATQFPRFIDSPGFGTGFGSFAFHAEFATSGAPGFGKFYTGHVEDPTGSPAPDFAGPVSPQADQHGVVTEWTMTNPFDNAITAGPANFSKRELLRVEMPWIVHGLQELAVDPEAKPGDDNYGCLFVCIGDGGSVSLGAPGNVGRLDSILGTIVRILPVLSTGQSAGDYTPGANGAYHVPKSNPFAAAPDPTPGDGIGTVTEIYAYGFRNPHRISWDAGGTGTMLCGMIGEHNIEEVEVIESGGHYGWPDREGSYRFDPNDPDHVHPLPMPDDSPPGTPSAPAAYSYPAAQYDHDEGAAIVGGYVYRGTRIAELCGMYVCGDIASGQLFHAPAADLVLHPPAASGDAPGTLQYLGLRFQGAATTFLEVLGAGRADLRFGIDHAGELFLLSKRNGKIYRVNEVGRQFVAVTGSSAGAGSFTVNFPTEADGIYRLWTSGDLRKWALSSYATTGDGGVGQLSDAPLRGRRFYRVEKRAP